MSKPADVVCEGDVCRRVGPSEKVGQESTASGAALLTELLGDSLLGQEGKEVPLSSITGKDKILGLYFSAHWCPPCRGFTPHLAEIYKKFKNSHAQKDNFEVVFISSDRDGASFKDYFAEMPWVALPYEKRDLKNKLSSRFKVRGIPTLVILDGATGELITANGRDAVGDDEECSNFPWRPQPVTEVIAGPLIDKDGKSVEAVEALKGKTSLIYFSAHWCPPCKGFTPKLVETYNKLKAAGKAVECVFVSGDRDDKSFQGYLNEMPWLAVPHGDKRISQLNQVFEVEGIPTLVVLDEQLNVITAQGRGAVMADPEGKEFPWKPKPVDRLSEFNVSTINEVPTLLLALPGEDTPDGLAAAAAKAEALMTAAATSAAGKDVRCFWGLHSHDLVGRVLQFCGEDPEPEGAKEMLAFINVQEQESYPTGLRGHLITAEAISGVVNAFKAGTLKAKPLGDDDE